MAYRVLVRDGAVNVVPVPGAQVQAPQTDAVLSNYEQMYKDFYQGDGGGLMGIWQSYSLNKGDAETLQTRIQNYVNARVSERGGRRRRSRKSRRKLRRKSYKK